MRFRDIFVLLCCLSLSVSPLKAQITFGRPQNINEGWRFILDSQSDFSAVRVNDRSWRLLDLPHDWSVEGKASPELSSCTGYLPGGIGWYRKSLFIPKSESSRRQYLYFEGVYCNSEVWVNGHSLGRRPNGFVSFIYDITDHVRFGADNVIAVKVDHSRSADSRWYTGSGIYRNVYLVSSSQVHMDNWGIFVRTGVISGGRATLNVSSVIVNDTKAPVEVDVEHRLYRKDGAVEVASSRSSVKVPADSKVKCEQMLEVISPALWDVDTPNLYRLETTVYDGNVQIDGATVITGIRETRFDPDYGFFLNGRNIKMKGVCLHHDAGALGAVVPEQVWRRRLEMLKSIGCNAIRMSHNPQAEVLYDLCDEMGFLVKDEAFDEWEFPKRKWIEGWNVGKNPGHQGYSEYFNDWAEADLASMVERDKNHPSVVMWSIGNEVDYPNDPYTHPILDHEGINQKTLPGYKPEKPNVERIGHIAKRLVKVVKGIDTSRVVTGAMAGVVMSNYTEYPGALDITGYNYTENRYEMDHRTYPDRIIYGSENRHEYSHWLAVRDNEYIFGQFLWTGIDYLGEAGRYPSRGFVAGLMDLGGFIKPRGYYRQSLWSDRPMVYVGTMQKDRIGKKSLMFDFEPVWNYNDGDIVTVAVFTNCDNVALYLDGRKVESAFQRDAVSNALYCDVPFKAGELKAVAMKDNKICAEYPLVTYGKAEKVTACVDRQWMNGKGDVIHAELNIVDGNGTRVLDACHKVRCEVSGAGELLKMENCNPTYMESFMGDELPAYKGRILAYVKSVEPEGCVTVKFSVPELDEEIVLNLDVVK